MAILSQSRTYKRMGATGLVVSHSSTASTLHVTFRREFGRDRKYSVVNCCIAQKFIPELTSCLHHVSLRNRTKTFTNNNRVSKSTLEIMVTYSFYTIRINQSPTLTKFQSLQLPCLTIEFYGIYCFEKEPHISCTNKRQYIIHLRIA